MVAGADTHSGGELVFVFRFARAPFVLNCCKLEKQTTARQVVLCLRQNHKVETNFSPQVLLTVWMMELLINFFEFH